MAKNNEFKRLSGDESVENAYPIREQLSTKFIIWNATTKKYRVFSNPQEYYTWSSRLPDKPFHEVIFGWKPQKLKIDVDIDDDKLKNFTPVKQAGDLLDELLEVEYNNEDKLKNIYEEVDSALVQTFYALFWIILIPEDVVKTESIGKNKFGYHRIIDNYYVDSNEDAKMFMDYFMQVLPPKYHLFIDTNINKAIQNFRMPESTKDGIRPKKIVSNHKNLQGLITYIEGCSKLASLTTGKKKVVNIEIDNKIEAEFVEKLAEWTIGHEYNKSINNLLIYKRVAPSHCLLCNRVHDNDSTMMFKINPETQTATMLCGHNKGKSKVISIAEEADDTKKVQFNKINEYHLKKALTKTSDKFDDLYNVLPPERTTIYSEPAMREFEWKPTLCVRANIYKNIAQILLQKNIELYSLRFAKHSPQILRNDFPNLCCTLRSPVRCAPRD